MLLSKPVKSRSGRGCFVLILLLCALLLSFVMGAGLLSFSFSFLLTGDINDKKIKHNNGDQVKEDESIEESSGANQTSTLLTDNERIIIKMQDLLKRMAQRNTQLNEKNTQLNEKLNKKEEEIDSLKNYLSYYDPMDICKHPMCGQRDPRGAIRLRGHRGLALLLRRIDYSTTKLERYNNLAYIMVPKAGSSTMKNRLKSSKGWTETVWLSPPTGRRRRSTLDPLIFTMIRDPGERVVSAYSTIMARGKRFAFFARKTNLYLPKTPKNTTAAPAWEEHFQKSIWKMMNAVKMNGWNNTKFHWNEHIIPQVEFMRGLNVSHIGCVGSINETLAKLHLLDGDGGGDDGGDEEEVRVNQYERNNKMPSMKFGSYDMLNAETKALIRELYEEDYALFDSHCVLNKNS